MLNLSLKLRAAVFVIVAAVILAACSSSTSVSSSKVGSKANGGLVSATTSGICKSPTAPVTNVQTGSVTGFIGHKGRWLTDSNGRVLLIHGINYVNKIAPFTPCGASFGQGDVKWIAQQGFKVVRLGVLFTGLFPKPGGVDNTYINDIASTVNLLAEYHIYTLLDYHQDGYGPSLGYPGANDGFPAWLTVTDGAKNTKTGFPLYYITNPAIQAAFQNLWDNAKVSTGQRIQSVLEQGYLAVAKKFANDPWVLGYEILNEPWPGAGNGWQDCLNNSVSGCQNLDSSELDKFYASVTKTIRSVDTRHLIFGEPFVLFNFGESPAGISVPGNDPNAGMAFHMYTLTPSKEPSVINYVDQWALSHNGAVLNTEWDSTAGTPPIIRQSTELNNALIPWIYWAYNANHNSPEMQDLNQPYPLAISGVPMSYNYDFNTNTMTLSWTSSSGVTNPITSIETPLSAYPNGYSVQVTGAKVISTSCGRVLNLEMLKGVKTASITITPGGNCK
jgi:endoglycosylceramidase